MEGSTITQIGAWIIPYLVTGKGNTDQLASPQTKIMGDPGGFTDFGDVHGHELSQSSFPLPLLSPDRTLDGMTHVHTAVDDAEPRSLAAPRRRL